MENKDLPIYPNPKETEIKEIEKQKYLDKYYNKEFIENLFA
tara:strand:+ start:255 stop:377 length:123 start_codon:yes stop_codon:yes gene_type:complete